jgi:N-acetylneuraminic acid mutarotase
MKSQAIGCRIGGCLTRILACFVLCVLWSTFSVSPAAEDTWTRKADMLTARAFLATSAVRGKIYVIGGRTFFGQTPPPILPVEEYDPVTNTWRSKADAPTARQSLSTSAVDGRIYAIGGWSGSGIFRSIVEEYDPATDTWTRKADMPTARSQLSSSVVNGKIYAIGGKIDEKTALSIVEEYDPVTDTWAKKTDMPTARYALSTSVVDGKIYAIGGAVGIVPAITVLPTLEVYDATTDTWTRKADMPTARVTLSTSVVDGKIYAIGGATSASVHTPAVEEYDTGLVSEASVDAKGKLAAVWGDIKRGW